jgi:DNA-binding transcriptional MerR regulator
MQWSRKAALESPSIPDRLYFKIGDVARICGLETYVLRFWETQFPQLKPNKSGTGQRLYRRHDVEVALEIKRLVHAEGYTLSGARQALETVSRGPKPGAGPKPTPRLGPQVGLPLPGRDQDERNDAVAAIIGHAQTELREIARLLAAPARQPQRRRARLATISPSVDSLFPS